MRLFATLATAALASSLLAQEPQPPAPSRGEGTRFRVAVDAVRIDAVVTDKDGNIVRDLTADDFEILQDGKTQKVTFAEFVPVAVAPAPPTAAPPPLKAGNVVGAPPSPGGPVRRETIQRSIALVVDDLSLSVESLSYAKRALHEFIDHAIQPGDLVALVRTGGSLEGLQPFTTDRRVLHAAVDNLKWNGFSRSGVEAFAAVNQFAVLDSHATFDPSDFTALEAFRSTLKAAGTLGALNLVIQGAKNLPGRKAVLFVSEGFLLLEKASRTSTRSVDNPTGVDMESPDPRVRNPLDRAIDQATRAGVVIYSIDARGLQTGGLLASDNLKTESASEDAHSTGVLSQSVTKELQDRGDMRRNTQEGMTYLAEQTGGFAILNTNDLGAGLARASQDVRDYYIIGYAPDAKTFARKGAPPQYHKLVVHVKRPGLKIRSRREFLGISDVDESAKSETPAQQLVNAAISPFTSTDIALRATTLPGFDDHGLYLRALLHIDARALTFTTDADGKSTASADVLGMVFDRDGTEVAHLSTGFSAALTKDAAQDALRDGLAYTLRIPIPRAGPYQVRFAIRDQASGKYGSAGEFVDLPDVQHGVFALSGIVLRSAGDLTARTDSFAISPSQAVRAYNAGADVKYACEIYNATGPVQLALSVWRGTERILAPPARTLTPPSAGSKVFTVAGAFRLGPSLPPGRYALQLAALSGTPANGRPARALQQMDFDVK
jgi:VWFA-related protein